jgi:cell fate (sporulation/competence/biofilm development) regulator YlbF (YheA/YmcA/DUF963 family)
MATNLYDAAYVLEKAIRESDEYKQLRHMYDVVNADESSKKMFDHFRQVQMNLQQKQMMGQDITQEEVDQAQNTVQLVQQDVKISGLMQAEQRMGMIIGELNQVIMKPLEELYGKVEG